MAVGAINVDLVVTVPALPGPGETVVGPRLERHGGGKGANAAVAAARAGASVRLVGAVGDDDLSGSALEELRAEGVDVAGVAVRPGEPTGAALIVVDRQGDNQIAVAAGANATLTAAEVTAAIHQASVGPADVVVVSTEVPLEAVQAAVATAAEVGCTCVLDPAPVLPGLGELVTTGVSRLLLTPNATECRQLADQVQPGASAGELEAAAKVLAERTGGAVIVTLGADGVVVVAPGPAKDRFLPAKTAGPVVDTTGAGDTFTGVLAAWLASTGERDGAIEAALVAAGLSVTSPGARTGMPARADIRSAV